MGTLATAGARETAGFYNQYYGFADAAVTTVTAATQQNLTTPYTISANEPSAGSAYEVTFAGSGTWGATQQSLAFTLSVGGVSMLTAVTVGAQAFAASAAFRFTGRVTLVWNTVGATGNLIAGYAINLTQTANNVAPPATVNQANLQANNSIGLADAHAGLSAAVDTTTSTAVIVKCAWGATTGAPTLTNRHTLFRRVA